jgi:trimeric autotransporter adhesin
VKTIRVWAWLIAACLFSGTLVLGQVEETTVSDNIQEATTPAATAATLPRLIRIRGTLRDETGKPVSGAAPVTFSLYQNQSSTEALWQETQNARLDAGGNYSILLGGTKEEGLPLEIFSSGEARWLGVQPYGQGEQPRVLLLAVAYALKAADAETLGGKPASAFALAGGLSGSPMIVSSSGAQSSGASQPRIAPNLIQIMSGTAPTPSPDAGVCTSVTSGGTASPNQLSKFTGACNVETSAIFESGGNVGIGNVNPAGPLDVSGNAFIRGLLTPQGGAMIPPTGTATATKGFSSNPLDAEAAAFNTTLSKSVNYLFRWQVEPAGNNSTNTGATLNLLYGVTGSISETGLSVNRNGIFTFAPGQTFPGAAGSGTVTSVSTGAGLTGGPITTTGSISIPPAGVTNSMLANPSITVKAGPGLSGGGTVALGGTITLNNTSSGGTITGVTAGPGLTGGGTSGAVSLSLLQTCAIGQILAWNGSTWICSTPGTGSTSGTIDGIAYFSAPTTIASTAAPTNGQILIGSTGKAPVLGTLTAGANISITNSAGAITIASTGGSGGGTLPFFVTGGARTGSTNGAGINLNKLWGFLLPSDVTTTEITYDVTTADNTANKYDIGIFDNSGALIVDLGAKAGTTFAPSKGFKTLKWAQGSAKLSAGRYYLGLTTNCTANCALLAGAAYVSFAANVSAGASSGGALATSVTPPADTWSALSQPVVVIQ